MCTCSWHLSSVNTGLLHLWEWVMGTDMCRETTPDCSAAQCSEIHPRGGGCGFWSQATCALSVQIQISCMRKWIYCLPSALTTSLQNKFPFLLSLRTSDAHVQLCLIYIGGRASKRSVSTYRKNLKQRCMYQHLHLNRCLLVSLSQKRHRSCRIALEIDGKGKEAQEKLSEIGTV